MPFRLQTSSDPNNPNWKNPAAISIYDNGWKTTKVGYVYDMGWKVVYPDPIIPDISVYSWGSSRNEANPALFNLSAIFKTLNDDETLFAELFSGSSAVGTPIATQTVTPDNVSGPDNYFTATFTSSLYSSGTYCMRGTVKSITENSKSVTTVPLTVIYPTVSIQSYSVPNSTTFSVSWTSTNQNAWLVTIEDTSGNVVFASATAGPVNSPVYTIGTQTSYSGTISPPLLGSTNYILKVSVESTDYKSDTASASFTSPAAQTSGITSYSTTETCSTIKVDWTTNSSTQSGVVSLYLLVGEALGGSEQFISSFSFTTERTHTFTSLQLNSPYKIYISNVNYQGQPGPTQEIYTGTLDASKPNSPTNVSATSSFYGNNATITWTPSTTNCTPVTGYVVDYKLASDSLVSWVTASDTISATATSYSFSSSGITLIPNTQYNFRVYAKSARGYSNFYYINLTTNNNIWSVSLTPPTDTIITTFSSLVLTAQLKNIAGNNISQSGVTINWSLVPLQGTSLAQSSSTTNSSGQATNTLNAGAFNGRATVLAQGPTGTVTGESGIIVALSNALDPVLSSTRTNFGYDVTHSNYNSSWGYTGTVSGSGFNFDGIWNDGFYTIIIRPTNSAAPVASRNALVSVTCTQGTWTAQPSATTRVVSTRQGYFAGVGQVTNSPTGTLSYSYTWYYGNGELLGTGQTRNITSAMRGRNVYCTVIATRTGGVQSEPVSSATISIPA